MTSDQPLNRLNVRNYASKDASVSCKLCPGAQVQVVNHTDDWASVFITGEAGSNLYAGVVQMQYLAFAPQQVVNGCTRVRTKYPLHAGTDGRSYRASWSGGETLPVGTMLTVVGVEGHFNIDDDYPDRFLCLTGDGRLVTIFEDGVLEPVETLGISAKVSSSVRMREAPGKTAVVIRTLSKGDRVEVLLRGEGWTQVQYKGETGYVMSVICSFRDRKEAFYQYQALKPEEAFVLKHADLFALRPIHAVILRIKRKGFSWFQGLSLHCFTMNQAGMLMKYRGASYSVDTT